MNFRRWPLIRRFADLRFVIFYVTTQCNARCQTCFFWQSLNTGKAPSLAQIEHLSATMPPFRTLLIAGGEPSLRSDLPQIVGLFRKQNGIHDASIPTNGLLPDRIETLAREIVTQHPDLHLSFNVSLDGFAPTHDRIRGVPGNFSKAQETIHRLTTLGEQAPHLSIVVNTVICPENYKEIVPFAEYAWQELNLNGHFFEIIRGNPKEMSTTGVPPLALEDVYRGVIDIQARYVRRARSKTNPLRRTLGEMLDIGRLLWQYRTQYRRYTDGQLWTVPCLAGKTIGVIEPDGILKACELRGNVADIAQTDWNFGAWYGTEMKQEVTQIARDRCDCTHVCFVQSSRDHSLKATFLEVPWLWFRYLQGREWL